MIDLYYLISVFSAGAMFTLAVILAAQQMPRTSEWRKFRLIHWLIAIACLLIFASDLLEPSLDDTQDNIGLWLTCIIAPFQALLFTAAAVVMIMPKRVTRLWTLTNILAITTTAAAITTTAFIFPTYQLHAIHTIAAAQAILISYYIYFYLHARRDTVRHLNIFYDDEMSGRLRWTDVFFFSALAMGLIALSCIFLPYAKVQLTFTIIITLYYTFAVILCLRYPITEKFLIKAMRHYSTADTLPAHTSAASISDEEIQAIEQKVQNWLLAGRCFQPDLSVDEIIDEIGITREQFDAYFTVHLHTHFRTWRIDIRIKEAQRLLHTNPKIDTAELIERVGYNDRSNFYKHFRLATGCSLSDYRSKLTYS